MSGLIDLLRLPKKGHSRDVKHAWRELTSSRFFELLKAETANQRLRDRPGADGTACQHFLSLWSDLLPGDLVDGDESPDQNPPVSQEAGLRIMKTAIRCADVASRGIDDISRAVAALGTEDGDVRDPSQDPWAWSCIQWLTEPAAAATAVPVVLCDETQSPVRGYLARLVVEVYPSGMNQMVRHPLDTFEPPLDSAFERALTDAWRCASNLVGKPALSRGVRWRVLRDGLDDRPTGPRCRSLNPTDRSISGAAARAFWFALQNLPPGRKIPDDGVVVLAQVSTSGELESVGHYVAEKVDAILDAARDAPAWERIDTIVVASQADHDHARARLDVRRKLGQHRKEEISLRLLA